MGCAQSHPEHAQVGCAQGSKDAEGWHVSSMVMPGSASGRALVTLQETAVSAPLKRWLRGLQLSHCLQANPLSQRQRIIPAYLETLLEPWGGVCGPERHQGQADAASTQQGGVARVWTEQRCVQRGGIASLTLCLSFPSINQSVLPAPLLPCQHGFCSH